MIRVDKLRAHEADTLNEINDWAEQHEDDILMLNVQDTGNSYILFYTKVEKEEGR